LAQVIKEHFKPLTLKFVQACNLSLKITTKNNSTTKSSCMKLKLLTWLTLPLFAILLFSTSFKIDPNNPPTGRTGAPGETTCQASGCHTGGSFNGVVEISGVPDTVIANQTYSITLANTSDAVRAGFQLTVLNNANQKTGTLTAGTGCSIGNAGGRQYVRQSTPRTLSNGGTSWAFTWKAPETVVADSIHFYFVTLCANGNGQRTGDNVLVSKKSTVLPTPVSGSINPISKSAINLFPNPIKSSLSIDFPGNGAFKIFNANGQLLLKEAIFNHKTIDVSKLQSGLYFVIFELDGQTVSRTFIKD
jgi:hypothetical protein